MKSESDTNEPKSLEEGSSESHTSSKKVVIPPKSSIKSTSKSSKSNFIINKFKLRSKSIASSSLTAVEKPVEEKYSGSHSLPFERTTPEGNENIILTKSASETNLQQQETIWKSAENLSRDSEKYPIEQTAAPALPAEKETSYLNTVKDKEPERTKSLENIKDKSMPAYGELILDASNITSNANQTISRPKDHLYKILVIGDLGTGKTSIIKRYVHRFFTQHYRATIGVDFALKVLNWDDNTLIRLQLWDIAGQERYGNMTRVYYKEAVGAFIVFDVTRRNTFESVNNWKADLDSKVQLPDGSPIPCVLLANKCDQPKEGIVSNPAKMDEYAKEAGFSAWFETSARDNINIDEAARALVEKILEYDSIINNDNKSGDQFSITRDTNSPGLGRKFCSC